jgi:hypothetical protein
MKHDIVDMSGTAPRGPMTPARLLILYAIVWLACGGVALLAHLVTAPRCIDVPTRVVGGAANLPGPWARPMAGDWPSAGKPPHAPSAYFGVLVLVLAAGVIAASLRAGSRGIQYLCIVAFVPLAALWIGIGFLELMVCAS